MSVEQSQQESAADEPIICYACGTELPEGRRHCPGCGRSQLRTCYCGNDIPVTVMTCPHCGADWSQSARVRRRKSRSHRVRTAQMAAYALGGAAVAVVLAALLNLLVAALARGSLGPGEQLPVSGYGRVLLAAETILTIAERIWDGLASHGTSLLGFLLVLLAGAAAGVLYYLINAVGHRHRPPRRTSEGDRQVVRVKKRRA